MRIARLLPALFLFAAAPLLAATPVTPPPAAVHTEPKCPLPLHECLAQYATLRERPWLGVTIEIDSVSGERVVRQVVDGSPAQKAGVKPGDVLETIGGVAPKTWFAGRAGWRDGAPTAMQVRRDGHDVPLHMTLAHIPEDYLAQILGAHILAGHLAYGDTGEDERTSPH